MPDQDSHVKEESNYFTPGLVSRFRYYPPTETQIIKYSEIRSTALKLAQLLDRYCPNSREKSTAIIKLEEAVMWANASIARNESEK